MAKITTTPHRIEHRPSYQFCYLLSLRLHGRINTSNILCCNIFIEQSIFSVHPVVDHATTVTVLLNFINDLFPCGVVIKFIKLYSYYLYILCVYHWFNFLLFKSSIFFLQKKEKKQKKKRNEHEEKIKSKM